MIHQSKFTEHAIAAVSRLAEMYADADCYLSSAEIARSRNLPKPVAAKVLSLLAQHGLVTSTPGPGGGYRLSRPPGEISLWDVIRWFDREPQVPCPYGPGWCGHHNPCPLHDSLTGMRNVIEAYLRATRFDVFTHHRRQDPD